MPQPPPPQDFGTTPEGRRTNLFTLQNPHLTARITDFGGRMVSIEAPDRLGRREHVLLGFDNLEAYRLHSGSFGTLLGRYANRIGGGRITIDGQTYDLARNEGDNTLHGGPAGFSKLVWDVATAEAATLVLRHVSPDGDQGFPGEVTATATYRLEADALSLTLEARTTKPTVINLSAHPYFNMAGPASADVLAHRLTVAADSFLPTDAQQLPTGEIRPVDGTPFDFRSPTPIGARIRQPDQQIFHAMGYDHCFVLRTGDPAVTLHDPASGRTLTVETNQPGVQVYTGNKLRGDFAGHGGLIYRQSAGLALEPQDFPDAPHHANFPSTILRPGQTYQRFIRYRFSID
jgi:aldose 1-epimerase